MEEQGGKTIHDDVLLNVTNWATQQWGTADFGDARRTKRAVTLGASIARDSAASLPKQTHGWGDLKAAYRLLNEEDVTHTAVCTPHWQATHILAEQADAPYILFVQDTTTLDFSSQRAIEGLGFVGDSRGYGCEMHSCLVVEPDEDAHILGLAKQTLWTRPEMSHGKETKIMRQKRRTEADIWAETLEGIGSVPEGCSWVSVGDRGSDIFSYVRRARALSWHCLLRVTQDRCIVTETGERSRSKVWIRSRQALASKKVILRGRDGKPAREVALSVTWESVTLLPPKNRTERNEECIPGSIIRCWNDEEAMEWILFSTVPVQSTTDALMQIGWYEHRWLIEEYHKCLKTGCKAEDRQLTSADALFALLGFLSITAVRLLQLRALARTKPDVLAQGVVDDLFLEIIAQTVRRKTATLTMKQFWHGIAKLGGFIGRKRDGEPGWQTLWRGWQQLSLISLGADWMKQRYEKCG